MSQKTKRDTSVTLTTPSAYGSHRSMVVAEHDDGEVDLKDDYGIYRTTIDRLDTGLADPRRNGPRRIK